MNNTSIINYIEFPATDLDVIQKFYEQVFGWKFEHYGADYRAFTDGHFDGGFYRSSHHSRTDNGAALLVLKTDDLHSVQADVVAAGGVILKDIFEFPGGKRFQFADPNGNELAVWMV